MALELPALPFDRAALAPHVSAEAIDHRRDCHKACIDRLNTLTEGTALDDLPLERIVRTAQGSTFDHAAQAWNLAFHWNCLKPGGGQPSGRLAATIDADFGDLARFREDFGKLALGLFGSGWAWLVQRADGRLGLVATPNAGTPINGSDRPLLALDVWEHAYYTDHRNARADYIEAFWRVANWDFVASNLA
ncbi:MAG: Fe-Mn family superoxide dismutase [Pseudoxanthomonas sp.]